MAITTSSGERYDSLENFIGDNPNEYVKMGFDAFYGRTKSDEPKQPVGPMDTPTLKGDWESEMITDFPPSDYNQVKDTMKNYKKGFEINRQIQDILDKNDEVLGIKPKVPGIKIIPGDEDYIRSKDLGKPVVYAMEPFDPNNPGKQYLRPGRAPGEGGGGNVIPFRNKEFPEFTVKDLKRNTTGPDPFQPGKPTNEEMVGMENISGGLSNPPKPANDNDKRVPYRDSFMSNIKDWIFGPSTPKPIEHNPEANQPYPSKEDADFAQQARNAYGTGYEDYVYGNVARVFGYNASTINKKDARFELISPNTDQEILSRSDTTSARAIESMPPEAREKLQYMFGRASLAVSRDPIASLGFSPKDVMIDALVKPKDVSMFGATWSTPGKAGDSEMYTNLGREMSSVVHESIHNGLNKLQEGLYPGDTKTPKEFRKILAKFRWNSGDNDRVELKNFSEHLARYTMMKVMGNPEKEVEDIPEGYSPVVEKMKERARALFEDSPNHEAWQTMIKELRDLAAKRIAEKHPGGPR